MPYLVRPVRGPDHDLPELKIREHVKREAPDTMTRPPFLAGMFGSRGSGKTTLLIKLLRWYDSVNAFDRMIVFSPTHQKDPKWEAMQNSGLNGKLELHAHFSFQKFKEIQDEQEALLNRYEKFLVAVEAYKKFRKHHGSTEKLTEDELLSLYEYDFSDPRDSEDFKFGRPSVFIAFDDHVGNKDVYRGDCKGPVAEFSLLHRHFNTSICFMAQVYKTGIPLGIRNNLNLVVFFANKSDKLKLEVAEEMSNFVTPEQFIDMWTYATESEDHGCFMITFDAEREEWRFRKNFDTLLIPYGDTAGDEDEDGGEGPQALAREAERAGNDPLRTEKDDKGGEDILSRTTNKKQKTRRR